MAFLYNKLSRIILLSLIIIWGAASFFFVSNDLAIQITVLVLALVSLGFTFFEIMPIFLLIFLSFTTAYSLYGFYFLFNFPLWLVMLAILCIFGYIFVYNEQKIGILGNRRLIYLVLFSLIVLEVFLTLNFYLVSPISKSLIISIVSYVFVGFCYTILAKHEDNKFSTYLIIASIAIAAILASSVWGSYV